MTPLPSSPLAPPAHLSDEQLGALLDIGFEFLCTRRVAELFDPAHVLPALDVALAESRVKHWHSRIGRPMRERMLKRLDASTSTLAVWLPAALTTELEATLAKPAPIPRKVIDELVASEKVRDAVRAMLSESLDGFIAKAMGGDAATAAGASGGGALRGAFGFGARAAAAAGKGLLGGFGDELQKKLRERVGDFVDGTVATLQARIAERLASDETSRALGKRRAQAFQKLLATPEPQAATTIRQGNPDEIEAALPAVLAHNLARGVLRDAIVEELSWLRDELSTTTVGELIDEAGIRVHAREALFRHVLPLMRALAASPQIAAWWTTATTLRA